MDVRRTRFVAALVLYLLWVTALGVLAAVSSRRPAPRAVATAPR